MSEADPVAVPAPAPAEAPVSAISEAEAARFLLRAQFSALDEDIAGGPRSGLSRLARGRHSPARAANRASTGSMRTATMR